MKPGRNDPCLCGSGKKYKHCCLSVERQSAESSPDAVWARVRRAIDGAPHRLARFVDEIYGGEGIAEAWNEFTLWEGRDVYPDSPLLGLFMSWLHHRWEPDPYLEGSAVDGAFHDRAPTRVFLDRHPGRVEPLLERYLEACLVAPFTFYEILDADAGRSMRVRDVLTGAECEVLERAASELMEPGDIFFGQLVPIEGIVLLEACSPFPFAPIDKIRIIELREQMHAKMRPGASMAELLESWEIEIRELYLELIDRFIDPRPPVMHNTDGELVKLQRVIFDVDSADDALAALSKETSGGADAEVERASDGRLMRARFAWTKPSNRTQESWDNTVLAHLEIVGTELVAHVNSDERAQAFRSLVERVLGGTARYRSTEGFAHDQSRSAEAQALDDSEQRAFESLPEVRAHLERVLERHYDDWLTQEIPALGGRRPVDVVEEGASGREKVAALIADMERHAAVMGAGGGAAALARLRERLGL